MHIEIDAQDWPPGDWAGLIERAADAATQCEPALANLRLQLSVLLTSDAQVQALNRQWRGRDRPTNVLSFPMIEAQALRALEPAGTPVLLGDIALAHETCANEAAAKGVALEDHVAHLIVHGLLHLAGHDHVHSDEEAQAMERLEIAALAKMDISDPYGDRD